MNLHLILKYIENYIKDPSNKFNVSLLKGLRNGIVYGTKVRFPHALVMTFLFKSGSLKSKLFDILKATVTHARGLALFVFVYKITCRILNSFTAKCSKFQTFVAAFITGFLVFGNYNKVNEQVNLYLLSRITYGLCHLFAKYYLHPITNTENSTIPPDTLQPRYFSLFAAVVWGVVLVLFEYEKDVLQPSLRSSMTYLYHDSQHWTNLTDLVLYNKLPIKSST